MCNKYQNKNNNIHILVKVMQVCDVSTFIITTQSGRTFCPRLHCLQVTYGTCDVNFIICPQGLWLINVWVHLLMQTVHVPDK